MGNRYADDIKRIVGIDPNQSALGSPEKKPSIPGRRGIAYVTAQGNTASKSGASKETQLEDTKEHDQDAGENEAGEGPLDPNNPQNGINGTNTGVENAEDIIDGNVDAAKVSEPQITEAGLQFDNAGALSGINAQDCETGKDLEIRLRGDFVPPDAVTDAQGTTISNQWEDANTPPDKPLFEQGKFWESGTSLVYQSPTPFDYDQIGAIIASQNLGAGSGGPGSLFGPNSFGNYYLWTGYEAASATSFNVRMQQANSGGTPIGPEFTAFVIFQSNCPGGTVSYCPTEAPKETQWPDDGKISLKLNNGTYNSSEYDADVPPKWKNPTSKVDFCFGEGRTGSMEVSKDNGTIIYETSEGAPTGIIRVYDSAGALTAAFDTTSGWLEAYRPSIGPQS